MKLNMKIGSGRVVIDGREFNGRSIQINGDRVIVDGVQVEGSLSGPVSVQVYGDVESLECSGDATIAGSAGSVKTVSGDVRCGLVNGSVQTVSGDVECGTVAGGVKTVSGDVRGGR